MAREFKANQVHEAMINPLAEPIEVAPALRDPVDRRRPRLTRPNHPASREEGGSGWSFWRHPVEMNEIRREFDLGFARRYALAFQRVPVVSRQIVPRWPQLMMCLVPHMTVFLDARL